VRTSYSNQRDFSLYGIPEYFFYHAADSMHRIFKLILFATVCVNLPFLRSILKIELECNVAKGMNILLDNITKRITRALKKIRGQNSS